MCVHAWMWLFQYMLVSLSVQAQSCWRRDFFLNTETGQRDMRLWLCVCVCVHTAQTTWIKFQVTFQYQQEWHFSVLIMTFYHSHFFDLMAAGERSQWMANREQVEEGNVFCELKKYSPSNWDLTYCLSLSFFHRQFLIPVLITFFLCCSSGSFPCCEGSCHDYFCHFSF